MTMVKSLGMDKLTIVPVEDIPLAKKIPAKPSPAELFNLYKIFLQLEFLCNNEKGIGIAAVQAGIPLHLFLVKNTDGSYGHYINCEYNKIGEEVSLCLESCLSLKNKKKLRVFEVERPVKIWVDGYQLLENDGDLVLNPFSKELSGFEATVFAHEIDHGFGITIDNIGTEVGLVNVNA